MNNDDLIKYIKDHPPSLDNFSPCAYYNIEGDQLEVYWSNDMSYSEQPNNKMAIHYKQEDENLPLSLDLRKATGVTIYNLSGILAKAGFKLTPINNYEE